MGKKIIIFIIIGIVILGGALFLFAKSRNETPSRKEMIYFYGENCPHCQKAEEFIKQNNIEEKISFIKKEVFNDERNATALIEKAQKCGLPPENIGVPFLWTGSECLVGDVDIINFFSAKD